MKIQLNHITKQFGATAVLCDVNLTLSSGRVYGFQGINGSGKTMLMRMVGGLIYPTSGEVLIDGVSMGGADRFPESMGLLIENPAFLDGYTGFQNLKLLASIKGRCSGEELRQAMERVGLDPEDRRKYRKYSLGMKQRLGIACAIMERPELLILDEPINSLDEEGISRVRQIVEEERDRGACVLLSCHDFEELSAMSDEIYKIIAGKLVKHLVKGQEGRFEEATL